MKTRAYLCVTHEIIDATTTRLIGVEIFSEPPWMLSIQRNKLVASIILEGKGKDYQSARDQLVEIVMTTPFLEWARPWIDPSFEAHQKRFEMQQKMKNCPHLAVFEGGELGVCFGGREKILSEARDYAMQYFCDHGTEKKDLAKEMGLEVYRVRERETLPMQEWAEEYNQAIQEEEEKQEGREYQRYLELKAKYEGGK